MDHRSKEYKELVNIAPSTQDLLSEEIDGEIYTYKYVPQCKVCKAPDSIRNLVDSLLLYPKTYREVLRQIRPIEEQLGVDSKELISYDSIRNHQKNHLPMDKIAIRETIERRAKEKNRRILDGAERLLTPEAFYEVIVQKGWEDIVAGRLRPNLNQTVDAMRELQKLDKEFTDNFRPEALISQLNAIVQAMRDVLPPEMLQKVLDKIEEIERNYEEANIVPAEAVEDEDYPELEE